MAKTQEIDHPQVLKLVEKEDVNSLIAVLKTSGNPAILKHAILFLGGNKAKGAVEPLITLLQSEFMSVRHYSALALGQIGDKKAIKSLSKLLTQPKQDPLIRKEALKSLVLLDDLELKETISKILAGDWGSEALSALKEIGQPAVKYLVYALLAGDSSIVKEVVEALGEIGEGAKAATVPLLQIISTTPKVDCTSFDIRETILAAIAQIRDPNTVEPLINFIADDASSEHLDYAFLNWIVIALGDIGDNRAVEPLIHLMLRNRDMRIKGTAAAALGKIGDNQAIEPLVSVLEDTNESEFVKDNAAWSLFKLEGVELAPSLLTYLKKYHHNILDSLNTVGIVSFIADSK